MSTPEQPSRDESQLKELTIDDRSWLLANMSVFMNLCQQAGIEPDEDEDTPDIADHLVRWWHEQDESARPKAEDFVNVIGVTVGDFLRHVCRLEWLVVADPEGTEDYALVNRDGEELVELFPMHLVGEMLEANPDGFVLDLLDAIWPQLEPLQRDEDDEAEPLGDPEELLGG